MTEEKDWLPLKGIDHIEFYVGNARQAAHFYRQGFGLTPAAYAGLETGVRDRASYVLAQGAVRFVVTAALGADHPISEHVRLHGDGVKDIALEVPDVESAYQETVRRGARGVREPEVLEDEHGVLKRATIAAYGETVHTFMNRNEYHGPFAPGYEARNGAPADSVFEAIDHVVGNVELGKMDEWVGFYRDVMGFSLFQHFSDTDIHTEYSALMSKVMEDGSGKIKFPINEPAEGRRKSQIEEYLEYYQGPGVQHIALRTRNIVGTVESLRDGGVEFLYVPETYYVALEARIGQIAEPLADLQRLGILADRDEEGYLLQIFTKPVQDRPTLFFEVIERHGSRGFGFGNFKALFEAIEREQALRGNL